MTNPNPFAPQVATEQAPAASNPFAPQQAAPAQQVQQYAAPAVQQAPPQQGNPFAAQQQAAQGYAPQQQYAPAAPQQVQQYSAPAPQQQYAAPPPAIGSVANAPAPVVSDGKGAKLPDMYGRLVIMFPHKVERVPRNPQYITAEQRAAGNVDQDRATVTVVVLDDGQGGMQPVAFGGAPYELPPRPHTDSAPLPYVRKGMWINQSRLISQLTPSMPAPGGAPSPVCGRVVKTGPERNAPWYLAAATEQDLALANRYLQGVASGEFPHPLAA